MADFRMRGQLSAIEDCRDYSIIAVAELNSDGERMKRLPRNPEKFEVLSLFTSVALKHGYRLGHADDVERFLRSMGDSLKSSHANDNMLHGKRVEALFAHVAGAMGKCHMVKVEDSGEIFVAGIPVQAPDYRLILDDRTQLLVEVKNCHGEAIGKPFVLKREYFDKLERYAELNSVPLKIAVFFSSWNRWCLLSRRAFREEHGYLVTTFPNAMAKSEMADIGDATLATLPELRLELMADPNEAKRIGDDGRAIVTFRSSRLFCGGAEIKDALDNRIAFHMMRHGDWSDSSEAIVENGKLLGVVLTARPKDPPEEQAFAMIGNLSSMISAAYAEYTVAGRRPVALDAPVDPEMFTLYIPVDHKSEALPLWRFTMQPNWDFTDSA